MSLRGYVKKWGKAPWVEAFGIQGLVPRDCAQEVGLSFPKRLYIRKRRAEYEAAVRTYSKLAKAFVAHARLYSQCPVMLHVFNLAASPDQVHHVYGRGYGGRGPLLLDRRLWLAVSASGHAWVDAHRDEARGYGWLAPVGHYNVPVPLTAVVRRNKWGGVWVEG